MKTLFVTLFLILSLAVTAQDATISGPTQVQPGEQQSYSVSYSSWDWSYSSTSWYVSGGTVLWNDDFSCTVQWDNTSTSGYIEAYENWYGQSGFLDVQIGEPQPSIYPYSQQTYYGTTAQELAISFNFPPPANTTYDWQRWNTSLSQWQSISVYTSTYAPGTITESARYRCLVNVDGTFYDNLESEIIIPTLQPGSLYFGGEVNYNSAISGLSVGNATGGNCLASNYTYVWEQSVEEGPWIQFGTGAAYPSDHRVMGNTRIRRKVVCSGQELYTNTLTIEPLYTSVDFENRNYVRELTVNKKGMQSWQQADQLVVGDKYQATTYLDGLGRPIQQLDREASLSSNGSWQDMVKHFEYGINETKDFLPYPTSTTPGKFKQNASTAQPAFIRSYFGESATASTYNSTLMDGSPLNRPIQQKPAGDYWGSTTTDYDFNDIGENVHIWTLDYASAAVPVTSSTAVYPTGVLSKIVSYDEKLNKVISYSDKEGRLILKKVQKEPDGVNLSQQHSGWLCTYYVYDDFGRLRYTITPKVVEYLDNKNAWSLTQSIIDDLCFRYVYDKKGRLIVKKQPGIGESYMVYDNKDRLVLTQHANQRNANNPSLSADMWSFTLYDQLNRDVAQGQLSNSYTRESIQDAVDKLTNETVSMNVVVNSTMTKTINANYPVVVQPNALNQPISGSGLINYSSFTHYDDYATGSVRNYGFNSGSVLAYDPASSSAEPTVKSSRVRGFVTGSWIKVLDNDNMYSNDRFMASSLFYDENGRALQVIGDNHKGNLQAVSSVVDFQTNQYDFSGKLLSSYSRHLISGGSTYTITSKNEYDRLGRLVKLSKNFNNSPVYKVLAEYDYDEFGQLKTKRLAPTQNDELEKQNYTYNLHGLLTGINKDYALSTDTYSQWDQYFSMYLDYVNKDGRFADRQTNGNLTGIIWRTPGDNTPRKFDFTYDRVGRLTGALFQQRKKPSETTWSNSETDFSVSLEYEDGNGNLKSLKQMGVLPGINGGVVVDDLRYSYRDVAGATDLKGNQLREVQDLGTLGSNNGILGDFKDGNTGEDYTYDAAGNLVKDLNKDIQISGAKGIEYNYLNKPVKITLQNKSTVEYTYDASGEKLAKKITNTQTSQSVTTDYIGDFVYKQSALQYILHEEGRVKVINPITTSDDRYLEAGVSGIALPNGKKGVFEYFLKDHLGSTRMVLTEEEQSEYYRATMENAVATTEEQLFGKVELDGTPSSENELKKTRYVQLAGVSSPWPNNNTDFVKLTAAEPYKQVGPNMLLKVMAGDKINATAKYFYYNNNSAGGTADPVSHVVNSLVNALIGPNKGSVTSKGFSTSINTSLNDSRELEYFVNTTQPSTGLTSAPKAFINIVFLDEQFHFIEPDEATPDYGTYSERVSEANNPSASFVRSQKAPKNGWVFVYLSNESNESVYFDDFYVTHEHGRIAQESHYYPNGLKIAGISSQAVNKLDTKYGYQGDFSEEESETGWDEFFLRNYDPQIGRWTGADPYDQYASSYVGMGNNPVNSIDPDGGENNDWIYNNLTHGWEWKDEIHNEAEFNASKYRFNYKYDKSRAKGNFDADFAGTWSTYHDDGGIEPFFPMKEVVIYSGNAKPFIFSGYQNARTDMPIPTNNAVISRGRKTLTFLEGVELGLYGSLPQYVYDGINVPWMGAQAMFYRQINSKTLSGHKANTSFDERLFNFVTFFSIPLAEGIGGIAAAKSPPNFRFDDLNSFRGAGPRDAIKWIEKNGWEMSGRTNSAGGIRFTNGRYGEQIRYMPGYKPGTRPDILKQGPYMEFSIKGQKTYVPLMSNPALRTL